MKTASIYDDGFTSQRYDIPDEQWTQLTGAAIGVLHPSAMARDYLGLDPSLGNTALYCLRRFGLPDNRLLDRDKAIAEWLITTPMEDVYLGIVLHGGSRFRYTITREIERKIINEQHAPRIEWGQACRNWAKYEKGVTPCNLLTFYGNCTQAEINNLFDAWGYQNFEHWDECDDWDALLKTLDLPDGYDPKVEERRIEQMFWDEQAAIASELRDEYVVEFGEPPFKMVGHPYYEVGRAENFLARFRWRLYKLRLLTLARPVEWLRRAIRDKRRAEFYAIPFWMSLSEDSVERQVNEAIYRTLQDLLRPVGVRDWDLNIVETNPPGDWSVGGNIGDD